jgi:hypothetical protein
MLVCYIISILSAIIIVDDAVIFTHKNDTYCTNYATLKLSYFYYNQNTIVHP